jgi:hypothetical protein
MGIDRRVGIRGHNVRYLVFGQRVDIVDHLAINNNALGMIFAKDITPSQNTNETIGNSFMKKAKRITIETYSQIEISNDYYLFNLVNRQWYRINKYTEETIDKTERYNSRPLTKMTIDLEQWN